MSYSGDLRMSEVQTYNHLCLVGFPLSPASRPFVASGRVACNLSIEYLFLSLILFDMLKVERGRKQWIS